MNYKSKASGISYLGLLPVFVLGMYTVTFNKNIVVNRNRNISIQQHKSPVEVC